MPNYHRINPMSKGYFRLIVFGALVFFSGACSYIKNISFRKPLTTNEFVLQQQIENFYYEEMTSAFFSANPETLVDLYSPDISVPMNWNQIRVWARKFFKAHSSSHFKVLSLSVDEMSFVRAVVRVRYSILTGEGSGSFSGYERDVLIHKKGNWYISSWEKLTNDSDRVVTPNADHGMALPFDGGESPAARGD